MKHFFLKQGRYLSLFQYQKQFLHFIQIQTKAEKIPILYIWKAQQAYN